MSKITGELKVNMGLLYNMVLRGATDNELNRALEYIAKVYEANTIYIKNDISHLKKKFLDKEFDYKYEIPEKIKRQAQVKADCLLKRRIEECGKMENS